MLLLPAGVVALLQQPLHGAAVYSGADQKQASDAYQHQQHAHRAHIQQVVAIDADGGEQRRSRQHVQHRANGGIAGAGVRVLPLALAHHAGDAVLRLEGLFL